MFILRDALVTNEGIFISPFVNIIFIVVLSEIHYKFSVTAFLSLTLYIFVFSAFFLQSLSSRGLIYFLKPVWRQNKKKAQLIEILKWSQTCYLFFTNKNKYYYLGLAETNFILYQLNKKILRNQLCINY